MPHIFNKSTVKKFNKQISNSISCYKFSEIIQILTNYREKYILY